MKKRLNWITIIINSITISRIVAAISVFFFLVSDLTLLIISIWAALSDFLDGFMARHLNTITKTGALLDQMADKIFHIAMFVYLLNANSLHFYFVVFFIVREALIVFLRYFNFSAKKSNPFGKLKTVLSYCLIIYLLSEKVFFFEHFTYSDLLLNSFELSIVTIGYLSVAISIEKSLSKFQH